MEEIRYKEINKIVGFNNENLLKVSLEIQTNHIKLKLYKLKPQSIEDFVLDFNNINWNQKYNKILRIDEFSEDSIFEITEEEIRELTVEYLEEKINNLNKRENWVEYPELSSNLDKYKGTSLPLLKWISSFSNEILHHSIMCFVPDFVKKIESIEDTQLKLKDYSLDEYVLYMGANEKYRGCIGTIERRRDSEDSPTLVEFPGRNKSTSKGKTGRFWCNDDNLLSLK